MRWVGCVTPVEEWRSSQSLVWMLYCEELGVVLQVADVPNGATHKP
jgi:hypothetical protein